MKCVLEEAVKAVAAVPSVWQLYETDTTASLNASDTRQCAFVTLGVDFPVRSVASNIQTAMRFGEPLFEVLYSLRGEALAQRISANRVAWAAACENAEVAAGARTLAVWTLLTTKELTPLAVMNKRFMIFTGTILFVLLYVETLLRYSVLTKHHLVCSKERKREGQTPSGRPWHRQKDNIKI
jgi:hypothetical protein